MKIPKGIKIWSWCNLIAVLICAIIYYVNYSQWKEEQSMSTFLTIVISIGSSIVANLIIYSFLYYKYLKKIPTESKILIEEMLNERLEHETTNHNAVLACLNPDTKSLSAEHEEIRTIANNIDKTIAVADAKRENRYQNLDTSQKALADSVEKLNGFNYQLQTLKEQLLETQNTNAKLNFKIDNLKSENAKLKQKVRTRSSGYER